MSTDNGNAVQGSTDGFLARHFAEWEDFKVYISKYCCRKRFPPGALWANRVFCFAGMAVMLGIWNPHWIKRSDSSLLPKEQAKHKLLLDNFRRACRHFPDYKAEVDNEIRCLALGSITGCRHGSRLD